MPTAASTAASTRSIVVVVILLLCAAVPAPSPLHAAGADAPTVVVLGDSLSAAYGMRVEQGWVTLLQGRLRTQGYGHRVVNASVTGETTGGALARLPRTLATHRPRVVIVELGGNDGLRGLPIADIRANLESIVRLSQQAGAQVLLVGMRIPPNYGPTYTQQFHDLFATLARKRGLALVPFLLQHVALDDTLMQDDGIHPTAGAQPHLLAAVWPPLQALLQRK